MAGFLQERSGFSANAPVLDRQTPVNFGHALTSSETCGCHTTECLPSMDWRLSSPARPPLACTLFAERSENWLTASNHNHLRITSNLKVRADSRARN